MARKRKGVPLHGWLAIDKPLGLSSSQVVGKVRWLTKAAKAGHGGTLDPLASGILPIALGEATKTVQYVMDGAKTYRFTVRWGVATESCDAEGGVIATSDVRPGESAIRAMLPHFEGVIEQVPPVFSAIKVDGQRAYDLARAGEDVELAARLVTVHRLTLTGLPDADHAAFEVRCGKGTYVRSLARDIALALGTVGHVTALRRTACGPFDESRAISLETLGEMGQGPALRACLLPVETALDDIPALALTDEQARRLSNGGVLALAALGDCSGPTPAGTCRAMAKGRLVALCRAEEGVLKPVRVLNLDLEGVDDVDHH